MYIASSHEINFNEPDITLEELIAQGAYEKVDPAITTENFGNDGKLVGDYAVHFAFFDQAIDKDGVVGALNEYGAQPLTISSLIEAGAQVPREALSGMVFALGSAATNRTGHRRIPYVSKTARGKEAGLYTPKIAYPAGWKFAVIETE